VSEAFGAWVVAAVHRRDAFRRELDFLHAAGWLWGCWRSHFRHSASRPPAAVDPNHPRR
jgi:hypothetical protein